jgi:hypothetical protein
MSLTSQTDPLDAVVPFSQLTPRSVAWLWLYHLGFGKLAMLDGDPDQGKSYIALDICARLSTGRPMPDGSPGPGVVPSFILQDEDSAEDTTRPRLEALGANLDHIHTWRDLYGRGRKIWVPGDLDLLDGALQKTGARFVVLDPVMAFLERSVVANSDQGVREALSPLAHLLDERSATGMMVRHLNKQGGTSPLYRGGGSIGLLAACRSGWLVARDPKFPERRVLAQVKNNLAERQPSLAYELRPRPSGPPTLTWLGESAWTASALLLAARSMQRAPERDRACEFLMHLLRDGPQQSRAVWAAAQRESLSDRTLRRARKRLGIRTELIMQDGVRRAYWLLPHQDPPADDPVGRMSPELTHFFAEMEQKYPGPCPLDEE